MISKLLSAITPRRVEIAGLVIVFAGAFAAVNRFVLIVTLCALLVYVLDRLFPVSFAIIKNFAKPETWPGYVSLGIASVVAAWHGTFAALVVVGVLTAGVGRLFNQLY